MANGHGPLTKGKGLVARHGGGHGGGSGARRGGLARARATPFTPENWDRVQPRLFAAKPVISSAEQALDAAQAGQAVVVDVLVYVLRPVMKKWLAGELKTFLNKPSAT